MSDNLTEGPTEHIAMIEIPLERAQQFRDLLVACRSWRGSLIPRTSTASWGPVQDLLGAMAVFDGPPCDHPRSWRTYRDQHLQADEVCGRCGAVVVPGLTPLPVPPNTVTLASVDPEISSPPES